MILSQSDIRAAVDRGDIRFDPPLEDRQWGEASIDLRLGLNFTKLKKADGVTVSMAKGIGNGAPLGGIKVCTDNAWFAARPSGTEDVYKVYAESFLGAEHLGKVQEEAQAIVSAALSG